MPKKGQSNGSVYYIKSRNKWIAQYYEFDYTKNKTVAKRKILPTEEEARKTLDSIMYQKSNSIYIKHNGIPLIELMKAQEKAKLDTNVISEAQYARIVASLKTIEKSYIANIKIEKLTSEEIQGYLNSLKNYSNSYIKKIYEEFTRAYKYAMRKRYIFINPMDDVIRTKSDKRDKIVRALTFEEQQELTKYLKDKSINDEPLRNVFLLQMYLGLRVSEALALRNSDIDLQHNFINISKTLTRDVAGNIIMGSTTKTYAGIRSIPIPPYLRPYIIEQMQIGENNPDKQLFYNNGYIRHTSANYALKKILQALNIKNISTHSLRHTYGTRCIEAGMAPVVLQRLMGHKDISVTLNTYTSVFNEYKERELEKVNQYYMENDLIERTHDNLLNKENDQEK